MAQEPQTTSSRTADNAVQLLNLAYDAIFTRGFRDRSIRYWNRGAEQLYGFPAAAAVGRMPSELLQTRYPEPLDEIEWELLATGRWEGELIQVDSQGRELIVAGRWALHRDPDGQPVEILEINRDVSEAKVAERRLRDSEERFRLLVDGVVDHAIFMLDAGGFVSSWNSGAERIKGYRAEEIIGRHLSVLYPPEDVLAGRPAQALAIAERQGSYETEGQRLRKDGTRFWADVALTPLHDDRGLLRGFAMVTRDITERRAQQLRELELERAQAQRSQEDAERAQEIERTKSDFLDLVSHELRTPLGVLRGYLSMLEDGTLGELPERAAATLPALGRSLTEMSRLIEELLELARVEDRRLQLRRRRVDLDKLVTECAQRVRGLHPDRVIVTDVPETAVRANADPDRIGVILDNLVRNAVTYSPNGGDVRIELETQDDTAFIRVRDRGVGIASEHLEELFGRFSRIETPETEGISGTGLGLYLSRELARLHDGDIVVESTPGEGSTFTATLPLGSPTASEPPPPGG